MRSAGKYHRRDAISQWFAGHASPCPKPGRRTWTTLLHARVVPPELPGCGKQPGGPAGQIEPMRFMTAVET